MLLVTGGAGFIGSNVVASLNEAGRTDIVVNDVLGKDGKWRNLGKRQLADFVPPSELMNWLDGRKLDAVIHMGAISETTARDGDAVMETNFRLSLRLLDWCTKTRRRSSMPPRQRPTATASRASSDDWTLPALRKLRPMNLYGWSKHLFDLAMVDRASKGQKLPPQWAGLKFFNVFGPNEYHKGEMMSLVAKRFDEAKAGKPVRLFKSHRAASRTATSGAISSMSTTRSRWCAGCSRRRIGHGIFNVGTGKAELFRDLISAMFGALGRRAEHRVHRRCRKRSATAISISRRPRSITCAAPGTMPASRRLEDGVDTLRRQLSRPAGPLSLIHDRVTYVQPRRRAQAAHRTSVLCIGDLMLDEFVYGEVSRVSPEAPTPVIAVKRSEIIVGGAGNVARNIVALGARCIFIGVVGDDDAGQALDASASTTHPRSSRISWSTRTRPTTRKVRFVSEHYSTHMLRADWERAAPVDAASEDALIAMPSRRCRASARSCCPTTPRAC